MLYYEGCSENTYVLQGYYSKQVTIYKVEGNTSPAKLAEDVLLGFTGKVNQSIADIVM